MSARHAKIEYHAANGTTKRLNQLRAAVLGANDGIVSIAGLVVGVAGASNDRAVIFTAGLAGVVAGAISMAAGEYVSVSSQRDTEQSLLAKERYELDNFPKEELAELQAIYEQKGLSAKTAGQVAKELSAKDVYKAHFDAELAIDPKDLVNPWHAAIASAAAFLAGAILPLLAITLPPADSRVYITFASTIIALVLTGILSARFGDAPAGRATLRIVAGGALAMVVTYSIGRLIGTTGL
jgi:vacuolar iron transporter family protein